MHDGTKISKRYVLFTRIPVVKTGDGRLYCDPLWEKDLRLHLEYIEDFSLCCPMEVSDAVDGLCEITDLPLRRIHALRRDRGWISVFRNILPNFLVVAEACKNADIVHSGGAGWAFPLSYYLLLLRRRYSFQWVMLIESSFWRLGTGERRTFRRLVEHYLHGAMLKRCVKSADARIFTQSFYRDLFLDKERKRTLINPAIWLDTGHIVGKEEVQHRHEERAGRPLSILYPARLVEEKGVLIVLDALESLSRRGVELKLTIMGDGPLAPRCRDAEKRHHGMLEVSYLEPVPYGQPFFDQLSGYDFVLVPNLNQEQPRVVFDAFSQGVAIIGSDTMGIRDITSESDALLFSVGDPSSLAKVVAVATEQPDLALSMGLSALESLQGRTHRRMHADRLRFLSEILTIA